MLASWIVATHFRPRLLRAALESIRDNTYPEGWTHEIIVAHHDNDPAAGVIAAELGAQAVPTGQQTGGGKRNTALRYATGDLVLVADDDDCQSPLRARAAIEAYGKGYSISELREFRYLHVASGHVVRWCGRGSVSRAPVSVGTARNYRRGMLQRVGGWKPLPRMIEKDIQCRIAARMPGKSSRACDLGGAELAETTICLQHDANIWDDRPTLSKGQEFYRGDYRLVGEGHWTEAAGFPRAVAARLGLT